MCKGLTADNARVHIYDPKVTEAQIHNDLSLGKFMWDHPAANGAKTPRQDDVVVFTNAYEARPPTLHPIFSPHANAPRRCLPSAVQAGTHACSLSSSPALSCMFKASLRTPC